MAQKFLSIKNFEKYQHYKQRNPPWVKLHKSMLGDPAFMKLSSSMKYVYIGLIILASETDNRVLNDRSFIAHRLCMPESEIDLNALYRSGFLIASDASIRRYHQTEERRDRDREETEREADSPPPLRVKSVNGKRHPVPLPAEFKFTPELKAWALEEGCLQPYGEFEQFTDKAKAKGWTYVDWTAAFKNWVRNELKWAKERNHGKTLQNVR